MGEAVQDIFWDVMKALALPIIFLLMAAFAGPFLQIGPLFAPESIKPSLNKISVPVLDDYFRCGLC